MTAATTTRDTEKRGSGPILSRMCVPLAAAVSVLGGVMVALNLSGYAGMAGATGFTSGAVIVGRAEDDCDNSSGAAGAKSVEVARGVFKFANSSSTDALTVADVGRDVSGTGIPAGTYLIGVADDGSSATMSANASADGTGLTVVIGKALASATYPSGIAYYKMHHATLKIDNTSVPIKGFEVTGDNALVRNYRGGSRFSSEIKTDGDTERTYGGTLNLEYLNNAQVDRYFAGAPFDLEIVATHGADSVTIAGYGRSHQG